MELTCRETFFEHQASMSCVPHTQSNAWLDYVNPNGRKETASGKSIAAFYEDVVRQVIERDHSFRLFFLYSAQGELLAAHLDYMHEKRAFYIMAANGRAAREVNGASQFIMERVVEWMGERGVETYDMGRIGVGNRKGNSVAEFKLRAGGRTAHYNGEYVWVGNRRGEWLWNLLLNRNIERY